MSEATSDELSFELDERLYPLEAVQSAAYAFTDRAYVSLESKGEARLCVVMRPKAPEARQRLGELKGQFDNELLHQALRLKVSESNRKIREFIVTKALVSAQPSSAVAVAAPAPEACPDCAPTAPQPAAAPVDQALEKEIDRLLAEIEKGDGGADPLGVNVPWEEKFGTRKAPKAKGKAKPAKKAAVKGRVS